MRLEYIVCGDVCMLQCPFTENMIGSKGCGKCDHHISQSDKTVDCKKATALR
jgi:hypothetical protein